MSWVIVTPGGAVPMTLTSLVATACPSAGLRIVRPLINALAGTAVAPTGPGPPAGAGVPLGRVRRPYAMSPTMTSNPARTTGGTRRPRSVMLGRDAGTDWGSSVGGAAGSAFAVGTGSVADTLVADGCCMPARSKPHCGQNGIPSTAPAPQRGQKRGPLSVTTSLHIARRPA